MLRRIVKSIAVLCFVLLTAAMYADAAPAPAPTPEKVVFSGYKGISIGMET